MNQQTTSFVTAWNETQKVWWDSFFDMAQRSTFDSNRETGNHVQQGYAEWRGFVHNILDLNTQWVNTMTQSFVPPNKTQQQRLKQQANHLANKPPVALELGATATVTKTVTEQDILNFADVSGDVNPVHLDERYAKTTRFKGRIAHGMLSASFISAVLGTRLPGPGTVYLAQNLKFRAPVAIDDTITTTVKVVSQKEGKPIYTLETICVNQEGVVVLEGEATILFDPPNLSVHN